MPVEESKTIKGRGAVSSPTPRFDHTVSIPVDDGWNAGDDPDFPSPDPATTFLPDKTKNLIATNRSPDIPFDQSINPYKGCEHGCIYCYARPTHAYLDLSPGLDFETRIFYKTNPVTRLKEALDHPKYVCKTLAMGTNTDPYQPGEKRFRITRAILETLLEYRHPVSIVTKGALILRDIDLLSELAKQGLASVAVSVTTLDNRLKTILEPRTAAPSARLRVIREMHEAGVPVHAMMAPVIPLINDDEIESVVAKVAEAGARDASYVMLRLPLEVEGLFQDWLKEHFPMRAEHVMARVRDMHNGRAYQPEWGTRMRGRGVFADLVAARFKRAKRQHGLGNEDHTPLRTDLFRRPNAPRTLF